jgi:hypothetical protein
MSLNLRGACLIPCLLFLTTLSFVSSIALAAPQQFPQFQYHLLRKIPLAGDGGWDYLAVDPVAKRIFISRATHVMVVDEDTGKVVGDIPDTKGVHGIALARDLGLGFTSNGGANTVTFFDLAQFKPASVVEVGGMNPDSILYDPDTKRVFTFNGGSNNASAIDAMTGKLIGTIALPGKPETPVLDGKGSIFVNIEDKNQLVELDTTTLKMTKSYPMAPCDSPSGIAMDPLNRRIFSGCRNKMMVIINADNGKLVAKPAIGTGVDADAFDPGLELAFASCGEGVLSVIHEDTPEKFTVVGNFPTQTGARTMALDPQTRHVFLVTADFKPADPPTADNPRPRPQMVPGTFVLLEFGPSPDKNAQ